MPCVTFRGMKQVMRSQGEKKKYLYFSLYSWGLPLLILVFTLVMEYGRVLDRTSNFKPRIGEKECFFFSETECLSIPFPARVPALNLGFVSSKRI